MDFPEVTAFDERDGPEHSPAVGWLALAVVALYAFGVVIGLLAGTARSWAFGSLSTVCIMLGMACRVLGATYTSGRRCDVVTGLGTVGIATGCLLLAREWWSLSDATMLLLALAFGVFGALYVLVGLVIVSGVHRGTRDRWNRRLSMATVGSVVLVVVAVVSLTVNGVVPL